MKDRPGRRGSALLLFVVGATLGARAAVAHMTTEATARVSLRDGHFNVVADVDVLTLVRAEPTALATGDDDALARTLAAAGQTLVDGTRLVVDGAALPLAVQTLPALPELRATAAWLSSQGQDHGASLSFVLQATTVVTEPRAVALSLPLAVGPVIATFVQPETRYIRAGDAATFAVLRPSAPDPPMTSLAGGAVLLGGVLLVATWRSRLSATRRPAPPADDPRTARTIP